MQVALVLRRLFSSEGSEEGSQNHHVRLHERARLSRVPAQDAMRDSPKETLGSYTFSV